MRSPTGGRGRGGSGMGGAPGSGGAGGMGLRRFSMHWRMSSSYGRSHRTSWPSKNSVVVAVAWSTVAPLAGDRDGDAEQRTTRLVAEDQDLAAVRDLPVEAIGRGAPRPCRRRERPVVQPPVVLRRHQVRDHRASASACSPGGEAGRRDPRLQRGEVEGGLTARRPHDVDRIATDRGCLDDVAAARQQRGELEQRRRQHVARGAGSPLHVERLAQKRPRFPRDGRSARGKSDLRSPQSAAKQ